MIIIISNNFVLSDNEQEIMDLLWKEKRPLSKAEIVNLSPNKTWKAGSIYILLTSLLKKGAIKEDGFVKNKTNYGRTFVPTLSENEYATMEINATIKKRRVPLCDLVGDIIEEETDISVIKELEKIIHNKIKEM